MAEDRHELHVLINKIGIEPMTNAFYGATLTNCVIYLQSIDALQLIMCHCPHRYPHNNFIDMPFITKMNVLFIFTPLIYMVGLSQLSSLSSLGFSRFS